MADVPVTNPTTGEIRMVPEEGVKAFTDQTGWSVSTAEQRHAAKLALGGGMAAGDVVQAAGEKAVRTATFGLAGPMGRQERERQAAFADEHPYIAAGAQAAGAFVPGAVAGALTGGAGAALGLSEGAAGVLGAGAEGLAGGTADEVEQARYETRDVSAGNILLFGLGGEIAGRALPHGLALGAGKIKRALTAVEEAAGEGIPSALAAAETRSVESQARLARDLPPGSPERAAALRDSAAHQYDRMATEGASDLADLTASTTKMGETNAKRVTERLRETMADASPAQTEWFTGARQRLDAAKKEIRAPLEGEARAAENAAGAAPAVPGEAPVAAAAPVEAPVATDEDFLRVKLFRAADDDFIGDHASFGTDPDTARAYWRGRDGTEGSPGFGGSNKYESKELVEIPTRELLDIRGSQEDQLRKLVEVSGQRHPGAQTPAAFLAQSHVSDALKEKGITWVRLLDDYPVDADVFTRIGGDIEPEMQKLARASVPEEELVTRPRKIKEPSAASEALPEPPKPSMPWPPEPAPKPARAPRTKTLANSPGMAPIAKDFDRVIDQGLRKLDKTTDTAEQYLAAREVKQQLQELSSRIGKEVKGAAAEQMKTVVDTAWQNVADGLTDKSLFGAAADIEREISSPFRDKVAQSLGMVEQDLARVVGAAGREFDPKKVRAFLKGDKVDRAVTQGHLEQVLEGAEEQLAAHERHGTWDPADIQKSRERIGRVRESLGLADEIHVARQEAIPVASKVPANDTGAAAGAGAGAGAGRATGEAEGALRGLAEAGLESIVNHVVPFGGTILKLGKRILGMDGAARAATKQVARNLAGVGLGYAERVAGRAARGAAGGAAAAGAMTALARFTGDYSGPEESFEAKRRLLDDEQVSPDVLYDVLGHTLGDLPKVNPDLFQALATRTAGKIRYMRENLPPGLQVSLLYPNGTPPSRSALRDFATQWNTVMDPESVLHDIDAGTATPLQMKTLRDSDPDLYQQLRGDVIEQVGTHFAQVPMSTKLQLDLLFQADGLAGPIFSSTAADMIGESMQAQKERGQGAAPPPPPGSSGDAASSHAPSGIEAIRTSVTNRGGT